jgi:xylulokinase
MSGGGRVYDPQPGQAARYDRLFEVYKDLYPALRDPFARLNEVLHDLS